MIELFVLFAILYVVYKTCDYEFKTYGSRIFDNDEFNIEVKHNVKWYLCFIIVFLFMINYY